MQSPLLFGANADKEDLSAYVNDASQPKPLNRRYRVQNPDRGPTRQISTFAL
jgi:hypothetical protein